jgi:hypothetical protein
MRALRFWWCPASALLGLEVVTLGMAILIRAIT